MKKHLGAIIFVIATLSILAIGIFIGVSQPARAVTIPDVSKKSLEVAQATLEAQGLEIETIYLSASEAVGTVFKQEPEAGSPLRKGQKVRLYVVLNKGSVDNRESEPMPTSSAEAKTEQQSGTGTQSNQGTQQNGQQTAAQRKAEIARQIAESNAAAAAAKQKAADELARIAAEQARVDALYNAMVAAQAEVQAARYAVDRAEYSVNDFASRGMLQSGAGAQAVQARVDAQTRLDNAIAASQAATDAWNAR